VRYQTERTTRSAHRDGEDSDHVPSAITERPGCGRRGEPNGRSRMFSQGAFMFKHILIATDGSRVANKAARAGIALANRLGAKITAHSAAESLQTIAFDGYAMDARTFEIFEVQARETARKRVESIAKIAKAARVPCASVVTKGSALYQGIIGAAKKRRCDVIIMGSHGRRGFSKLILGSVTQQVLAHTKLPVLVFR
jgi:nucleotide-binding universal stress UspA family protein